MFGHGAPEFVRFFPCGLVHGVLIHLRFEVSDGVPVDDYVHSVSRCQGDTLVEKFQVLLLAPFTPCGRVNGKPYDVRAPVFHFTEIGFIPMSCRLQFIGVAGI